MIRTEPTMVWKSARWYFVGSARENLKTPLGQRLIFTGH